MDAAPPGHHCAPKWKAARENNQQVKISHFDETGWFPLVCRHGMVWVYSDMIKSGELLGIPLLGKPIVDSSQNQIPTRRDPLGAQESSEKNGHRL